MRPLHRATPLFSTLRISAQGKALDRGVPLAATARSAIGAVALLLCAWALAGFAHASDPADLRSGVVQIVSKSPDGLLRKGAGFIVRLEADAAFIVTAAHVVEGDKTPQVDLFTRPLPVEAQVARMDVQLDIALLVLAGGDNLFQGLQALPLDLTTRSAVGQQVTTIGFPAGLSWAVSKPNVASQEGVHLAVVGGNIDEGSSGGPVLDNGTVVAMVTTAQRGAGRAIPAQILALVLQGWRLDLTAESTPPRGAPQERGPVAAPERVLTWERELGPTMAHEIHPTSDGNYLLSGYTRRGKERKYDALVAKLDRSGSVLWERRFPTGGDDDLIYSSAELAGGGYVVGGEKTGQGAWVAALNDDGELIWERTFPNIASTMVWRVRSAKDGGVVFAGSARPAPEGRREVWIVKLDRRGETVWTRTYWNPEWSEGGEATPFAFRPTMDGGYILAAVHGGWSGQVWILKLDANGGAQWRRGLEQESSMFDVIELSRRGGYVLVGTVRTEAGKRGRVVRLDRDGGLSWDRTLNEVTSERLITITEMADGGYVAAGDGILRLDGQGGMVSQQTLPRDSMIIGIERAPDGGYIAAGWQNRAAWVLKLNADAQRGAAE